MSLWLIVYIGLKGIIYAFEENRMCLEAKKAKIKMTTCSHTWNIWNMFIYREPTEILIIVHIKSLLKILSIQFLL